MLVIDAKDVKDNTFVKGSKVLVDYGELLELRRLRDFWKESYEELSNKCLERRKNDKVVISTLTELVSEAQRCNSVRLAQIKTYAEISNINK